MFIGLYGKLKAFKSWLNSTLKLVWYWLIPILNFFDLILMRIPYFIYISWFFYSYVIYYTKWYADNRQWIDLIDSILYAIVIVHALYAMRLRRYTQTALIIAIAMFLVLCLQIEYYSVNLTTESYIRTYKGILWSPLATIIINTSLKISEK